MLPHHRIATVLKASRAAIDLASIMVGVLVIGLIAGVISATVFAVIPWAQDRAAEGDLDAVKTAQSAYRAQHGGYAPSLDGLIQGDSDRVSVHTGPNCYAAFNESPSGAVFYVTSATGTPAKVPATWPTSAPAGYPEGCTWPATNAAATTAEIRNLIPDQTYGLFHGGTSLTRTLVDTGGPNGGSFIRGTSTATVTIENRGHYNPSFIRGTVNPSKAHVASVWVRSSLPLPIRVYVEAWNKDGGGLPTTIGAPQVLTPNVWTRLSVKVPSNPAANGFTISPYAGNFTYPVGSTMDFANYMITEGEELYPYADGDTPGWRWTGEPGKSVSAGRPYTLESIAGPPAAVLQPNQKTQLTVTPYQGRTVYAVYDILNQVDGYESAVNMGSIDAFGIRMQAGGPDTVNMSTRFDTSASTNVVATSYGARTTGRHVGAATVNTGITEAVSQFDAGEDVVRPLNPGVGMPNADTVLNNWTGMTTVTGLAYVTPHDRETRTAISNWLRNAYGAP